MTAVQSVTSNAIPLDDFAEFDRRMERRHSLAELIREQAVDFLDKDSNMDHFLRKSVSETQESLHNLIAACVSYQRNLGWETTELD